MPEVDEGMSVEAQSVEENPERMTTGAKAPRRPPARETSKAEDMAERRGEEGDDERVVD